MKEPDTEQERINRLAHLKRYPLSEINHKPSLEHFSSEKFEEIGGPLVMLLKQKTEEEHKKTENSAVMRSVMGGQFSLEAYQALLKRMFSFYMPIERKIKEFTENSYRYIAKHPLLQADLDYIYDTSDWIRPEESKTPKIDRIEDFLGVLYVLEGSTLGGALIHKALEPHIDVYKAASFFHPYGKEIKNRWDETRAFINGWGKKEHIYHDKVCDAAIATFQSIQGALNDESIT